MQSLGYSYPWGPTNQFRPTIFFSSSLANIPERGMKVETNEVLEPVTGRNEFIEGNSGQRSIEKHYQIKRLDKNIDGAFRSSAL